MLQLVGLLISAY